MIHDSSIKRDDIDDCVQIKLEDSAFMTYVYTISFIGLYRSHSIAFSLDLYFV